MKSSTALIAAFLAVFTITTSAHATIIVQDTIDIIPGTPNNNGGNATTVDHWYFTVNSAGTVSIDTMSWEWDADSDGIAHFMDPYIYLFADDGSLDSGDYLDENDDSEYTYDDGSIYDLDSYLSVYLDAGTYVLAIGDYELSESDAIAGVNMDGYYPYATDGVNYEYNYEGCILFDCSYADYQITFDGDITLRDAEPNPVPEPTTVALLGLGLFGIGMLSRRRKQLAVTRSG